MAGRSRTQPSLLALWQKRFKSQVARYLKAKEYLDTVTASDTATKKEIREAKEKERLARGVVRGGAEMLIILGQPFNQSNLTAIKDLEIDYHMPGERSKPRPGTDPYFEQWFKEYYGEDAWPE